MFCPYLILGVVVAVKAMSARLEAKQNITTLDEAQIAVFKPFTFFASAAYCPPSVDFSWSCGVDCEATSDFILTASGGNGVFEQFWYVGFSLSQDSVIVSHQGTDPTQIVTIAADLDFNLRTLHSGLFSGIDSSVKVHEGFADSHSKSATAVLSAVKSTLTTHNSSRVTIVGHSLGAALGLLDSIYLPLHIPGIIVRTIGYELPRVGNQAFADYVDAHVSLTRINNREDVIPTLPGRFLGYRHPSGEIHIENSGAWNICPGQDNDSDLCATGDLGSVFESVLIDSHQNPYDGVIIGCERGGKNFLLRGSLFQKIGVHFDKLLFLVVSLTLILYKYASEWTRKFRHE